MEVKNKRCECFLKHFKESATWHSFTEDGVKTLIMPCISLASGLKIRFNFCPICGEQVRDIQLIEKSNPI
jgi:hypothetical protein